MQKLTEIKTPRLRRFLPRFLTDKGFKGTVVNRALQSLHGGSLGITFTVPLTIKRLGK